MSRKTLSVPIRHFVIDWDKNNPLIWYCKGLHSPLFFHIFMDTAPTVVWPFWKIRAFTYIKSHNISLCSIFIDTGLKDFSSITGQHVAAQWLKLALYKWCNSVNVSSFTWGREHTHFPRSRVFWFLEYRTVDEVSHWYSENVWGTGKPNPGSVNLQSETLTIRSTKLISMASVYVIDELVKRVPTGVLINNRNVIK
jgi:hypothetical protein